MAELLFAPSLPDSQSWTQWQHSTYAVDFRLAGTIPDRVEKVYMHNFQASSVHYEWGRMSPP